MSKAEKADGCTYALIVRLAKALEADEDELLLLAEKMPPVIKRWVLERPDAFLKLAGLDDKELDRLVGQIREK